MRTRPDVAFVLWDGTLFGGAETATIALASRLAESRITPNIVFVGEAGVYVPLLEREGLSYASLGLTSGVHVLRRPREFAKFVGRYGPDAAVLTSAGFMARSLRVGGYRSSIVAVEHGGLLQFPNRSLTGKFRDVVDRAAGLGCVDCQVAVSEYLYDRLVRVPHAKRVEVIHNGVDVDVYATGAAEARLRRHQSDSTVVIGVAGRLVSGKGVDDAIRAVASLDIDTKWELRIAGEGQLRASLERLTYDLGVEHRVSFEGWVADMPAFWKGCDIAVAASNGCIESFGMTPLEAFASGIPALVSESGGLTEVLGDVGAGSSFPPGDVGRLAELLRLYIEDDRMRALAGQRATRRAAELSIERCASRYETLIIDLVSKAPSS